MPLAISFEHCSPTFWSFLPSLFDPSQSETDYGVVVGSRAHLEEQAVAQRSLFRTILMYGFHLAVAILCVRGIRDTQCGFKLFTHSAAQLLFSKMHIDRWYVEEKEIFSQKEKGNGWHDCNVCCSFLRLRAFDVELLYIARRYNMPIREVAVNWLEIEGKVVECAAQPTTITRL